MGCGSSQPAADAGALDAGASAPSAASTQRAPAGASALERAVLSGDATAASAALHAGAPLQKPFADGRSLLCVATERDDVETARLLLARGAGADARSGSSRRALEAGAAAGASAALALLRDRGARDKDATRAGAQGGPPSRKLLATGGASGVTSQAPGEMRHPPARAKCKVRRLVTDTCFLTGAARRGGAAAPASRRQSAARRSASPASAAQ